MAEPKKESGLVTREMDTNVLFSKFTVDEIKDIEKKTRADIERKKEELRLMVGERYRDLIEAADTIKEMKHSAENVTQSIKRMHEMCQGMRSLQSAKTFSSLKPKKDQLNKKPDENQFYGLAAQIKLLMDMPEKIWSAIDSSSYLHATQLFLLARHVNTGLQLDSGQSARILQWFPVLSRQWAAISHFRTTILQSCRDMLKESNISDEVAAECLCSILLLEDTTPRQVFNELLLIRTGSVQQLFLADQSSRSIKSQVCDVVLTIVTTVHQIYSVFYHHSNKKQQDNNDGGVTCNLLMSTLERMTDKGEAGRILKDDNNAISIKRLPAIVKDFRPVLVNHAAPIPEQNLRQNCQQWINTCIQDVSTGLTKVLTYITSVKGLAAIRDEVWGLLNEDVKMKTWDVVCAKTLDTKLLIWESLFQQLFLNRTKEILQNQFDSALTTCKQQISKVLEDIRNVEDRVSRSERDLSHYIWKETAHDTPTQSAWVNISNKSLSEAGTLLMKSRAYTPAVQSLCKSFDVKLRVLLEDGNFYLKPVSEDSRENRENSGAVVAGPFDKFADHKTIQTYLQKACEDSVHMLLDSLNQQLYACKQQLTNSADPSGNALILDRVLLLGRFSSALSELSTNLHKCMGGGAEKTETIKLMKKTKVPGSKTVESQEWRDIKHKLTDFSAQAFSTWVEYTSNLLVHRFSAALQNDSPPNVLQTCTQWDKIEIQEETEDSQTIKSHIRVPMQSSWFIQGLLFELCAEINRIGGHALNRSILYNMVEKLSEGILSAYQSFLKQSRDGKSADVMPITQARALQLLFDVRFITGVLPKKDQQDAHSGQISAAVQSVIERLESYVDPFDLDVFAPYMRDHLSRQTQRANVLFGALTSLDRSNSHMTSRPAHASQQEQHNVLPLVATSGRFPLLPLSVQQQRSSMAPPIVQPPKPKLSSISGPSSPPPVIPNNPQGLHPSQSAASFFSNINMSTIWFTKQK